jgi:murein L,D-transpeptidase YafK
LAVEARNNGQENIPIHLFPSRLSSDGMNQLRNTYASSQDLLSFWENLQDVYEDFETTKKVKRVHVNTKGKYFF